jgi:heparin/heparan-sulfate lyase
MRKDIFSKKVGLFTIILLLIPVVILFILKNFVLPTINIVNNQKIYPHARHPRLFVNKTDIKNIKDRIKDTENGEAWKKLLEASKQDITNQSIDKKSEIIKAYALNYLLYKDKSNGIKAIKSFEDMDVDIKTLKQNISDSYALSNTAGEIMVAGSMVYDWCYSLLSVDDKNHFIQNLKLLSSYLETGGYLVGHGSGNPLMLYKLSAGIAVYDEDPEIFNSVSQQIMNEIVPARKFTSTSEMHYQGTNYSISRYESEMYATILYDKIGYKNIFDSDYGKIPLEWIYALRPDGQLVRDGDTYIRIDEGSRWTFINTFLFASYYYNNPYIQQELIDEYKHLKEEHLVPIDPIFQILFFDMSKPRKQFNELPLTKYFGSPIGYMIARTGWDKGINSNSVVASFKVGEYHFNNHEHLDSGSFQIYYKGALAIDSGIYHGDIYGTSHDLNYNKRTIAHNSLLVYNPKEVFQFGCTKLINDGGQRFPSNGTEPKNLNELLNGGYKFGNVLRHDFGPDKTEPVYSFVEGDLTNAYSSKIEKYTRSFLFINNKNDLYPATVIIRDKVTSSDFSYKKYFLLHSINKPQVRGNVTTIVQGKGKLINTTISTKKINIETVGGTGNEFNVFGVNFPYPLKDMQDPLLKEAYQRGSWRVQISPNVEQKADTFLNVMQIMDSSQNSNEKVTTINTADFNGVNLKNTLVFYINDTENRKAKFELDLNKQQFSNGHNIIFPDLPNGKWTVKVDGKVIVKNKIINEDNGVLLLNSRAGTITLEKNN